MNETVYTIREMESADYLSVAAVWRAVFDPLAITDETFAGICAQMQCDDRYRIFVAEKDGAVIGFVSTVESLALNLPGGYIHVNALAVLPEFRRCGIGKQLMERVETAAAARGVSQISLASGFKRTEAHAFYEHLGYKKSSYWLSKRI